MAKKFNYIAAIAKEFGPNFVDFSRALGVDNGTATNWKNACITPGWRLKPWHGDGIMAAAKKAKLSGAAKARIKALLEER